MVNKKKQTKDRSIIAIGNIADNAEHNSSSVKEKASTLPGLHHLCQNWLDQYMKVSTMRNVQTSYFTLIFLSSGTSLD